MPPTQARSIVATAPEPVLPGRVTNGRAVRSTALFEPGFWRFQLAFPALRRDNNAQSIHDWLLAGNEYRLDLSIMNLPTIDLAVAVTGQSLIGGLLQLDVDPEGFAIGQWAMYAGRLVKVLDVGAAAIGVLHRPDVLPALGQIAPVSAVDVYMPDPSSPSVRRFGRWGEMNLVVQTKP